MFLALFFDINCCYECVLGVYHHRSDGHQFNPRNPGPLPCGVGHRVHKLRVDGRDVHSKGVHALHGAHALHPPPPDPRLGHRREVHFQDSKEVKKDSGFFSLY